MLAEFKVADGVTPLLLGDPQFASNASSPEDRDQHSRPAPNIDLPGIRSLTNRDLTDDSTRIEPLARVDPMANQQAMSSDQAMDRQVTNIQPGGGVVMSLELAWGRLRRGLLRTFFPGYVQKMRQLRLGQPGPIAFDPVDPRDVKYYRNQGTYYWLEKDDPFRWRDNLPFVRVGLAELVLMGGGSILLTLLLGWIWWPLAIPMGCVAAALVWFFRDPVRVPPTEVGQVVSPADGKIAAILDIEDEELGPCVEIGIFLSIFNVHANRSPVKGLVTNIRYRPGKMLNALRPESAKQNERMEVTIAASERPYRKLRVNQITGQFARRIVCWVRPGDKLGRGEMFGMIKLGSRTELILPRLPGLEISTQVGDTVHAGTSVLALYKESTSPNELASEQRGSESGY